MPAVSVITLTFNRLHRLLAGLDQLMPQLGLNDEILVIDTGSTDGTREHFRAWSQDRVRFLTYDAGGSWAEMRNFGLAEARGDLIAFLDDDCTPADDWMARGRAALADADAVGGMVRADGIAHWPTWWHPDMGWMVGLAVPGHCGPDAGRIHYPLTANLWVRASAARAVGFQELGGALGGKESARYKAGREDANFWRRLRTGGYRTRFDPQLVAGHAIDHARLSLDYLRQRAARDGEAYALREGQRADAFPLAYQWWNEFFRAGAAPACEEDSRWPHWHYHHLNRRRHGRGLRVLTELTRPGGRIAAPVWTTGYLAAALVRRTVDRAKALAYWLTRPYWRSRPQAPLSIEEGHPPERLAILAMAYLGDLVLLQSVLRGLREQHPALEIYVLAPPVAEVALRDVGRLNLTILPRIKPGTRAARDSITQWLGQVDPDAIVAPYLHGPWGETVTQIRRPQRPIVAFDQDHGLGRRRLADRIARQVHKRLDRHEIDNLGALLAEVGLAVQALPARIQPRPTALGEVRRHTRFGDATHLRVMINPDAGHAQKEWTDAAWAALVRMLLDKTDADIIVNASRPHPDLEAALGLGQGESASGNDRIIWLPKAPLEELIAWLSVCAALVTVDAGPQHLAHALGVPSLTLYGPMDERRWADYFVRPIHSTLRACAWDLTPEERRNLPVNHQVALITPESVWKELETLLHHAD